MQVQAHIIDQILDSARALHNVLRAEPKLIPLPDLLEHAASLARRTSTNIRVENRHDSPAHLLEVDAARLERAIANLIVHAAKYSSASEPVMVASYVSAAGAEIRVAHAGGGLDNTNLCGTTPSADSKHSPELQMALACQLVELQGGRMELRSAGKDCPPSLVVRLPARVVKRRSTSQAHLGHRRGLLRRLDGIHVVLVEDDPDALEFLALVLRQAGATVAAFPLVQPAFDFFVSSRQSPDIIVSDIAMPIEDGYSLLRRLRDWEATQARIPVPAIAVSAFARDEDVQRALGYGFDRHVAKPVDAAHLVDLIASWIHPKY
jgi:CheY-like chemotaxis protein